MRSATLVIFAIAGIAACSGQSCSCITPIKGGFPITQRRENGVQTRITPSFLQYVSDNATTIVPKLLPGGTTFNIPPTCPTSGNKICCGTPQPTCGLSLDPRGLVLTPGAPNKLHFDAHLIVKTINNLPITASGVNCNISIDTTRSGAITMRARGDVLFPVDPATDLTGLGLSNATIDDLDQGDVNLDEAGSDALCGIANVGLIKGFILDYLKGQVATLLSGVVEGQLCQTCVDKSDCSALATACAAGKCIGPDGVKCVQELGVEGRAAVGALLAGYTPATAAIDIMEAAGGYVIANNGLSLGVLGGSQADPHNACVPLVTAPPAVQVAPSPTFQGDVIPGTTTPYHVGIGIHLSHLTTLGYAFWDAGGLCLAIGSANFMQISAKTLSLIMPSLADLIRSDDAAMAIRFRPQNPPVFTLGKGTFKMVGGKNVVDEPLITMVLKDMAGDIYLFVDDRYVRIATVTGDLTLPIGLDTNAAGALVPLPGDLTTGFNNIRVTNSELLSETAEQLAAAFPTLFGAGIGGLFNGIGTFTLPSFAGLTIHPKLITSTDPGADGKPQYLAIFADVKAGNAITRTVRTQASILAVSTPPTAVFSVRGRDGREPSVTVEVGTTDERPSEWSWSFDGGAWHPYQTTSTLTLTDAGLWLQGRHIVAIRSRVVGDALTTDRDPVELQFFIDSEAPNGDFIAVGGKLVPSATDRISPAAALTYRVNGGEFVRLDALTLPGGRPDALVVEVRDEAGNTAVLPYRQTIVPVAAGCSLASGRSDGGFFAVLCIAAILLLRRRALAALAILVLLPASACKHSAATGDMVAPSDAIGRTHDVRFFEDSLQIVAYDATFGDLAYGKVALDKLTEPFDWILVDGDDATSAHDSQTGYRHGHTAPGPDVGFYAALALTSGGDPRIAYHDATSHAVKFASGGFPFSTHEIDRGSEDGSIEIGPYPAIALDAYDTPTVAYMAIGLGDGTSGFRTEMRLAKARNDSPSTHNDWEISVIDTAPISCAGRCGAGTACVVKDMVGGMPNKNPAQSTCLTLALAPCMPGCSGSQACIQNACKPAVASAGPATLPAGTGLFTKLLRSPSGALTAIFFDQTLGQLKVATESADGKLSPVVIDGKTAGQNVGQFASGSYAPDGTLHVAYADSINGALLYRSISSSGSTSQVEVVDNGIRADGLHPVGASASVSATADGVAILYQDQGASDLVLAEKSGSWAQTPIRAGADGSGFSSHLVNAKGARYYTSWIFDRAASSLGKLLLSKVP